MEQQQHSPLLFLFVIDSLRDCVPAGVECSLYAEDVALWSQSRNKLEAQAAVGAAFDAVHAWSLKKKLTLNTRKYEVSFFSPFTHEARWRPTVTLGNDDFFGVAAHWQVAIVSVVAHEKSPKTGLIVLPSSSSHTLAEYHCHICSNIEFAFLSA